MSTLKMRCHSGNYLSLAHVSLSNVRGTSRTNKAFVISKMHADT